MEVVAEARDGREALLRIRQHQPNVVLMDIAMPELNGLEVVRQISKEIPSVRTIILSMHSDEEHVLHALQAGASGYLVKGSSSAELELAINAVARGEVYLSPGVSKLVVDEYLRNTGEPGLLDKLTARQREVLQMIAEGNTTKQIALALKISVKTVESHRSQLMKRLGSNDIAGLVRHALKMKLVDL